MAWNIDQNVFLNLKCFNSFSLILFEIMYELLYSVEIMNPGDKDPNCPHLYKWWHDDLKYQIDQEPLKFTKMAQRFQYKWTLIKLQYQKKIYTNHALKVM